MGGIATSIKSIYASNALKVAEGESQEYIITRPRQFDPVINVINLYGTQESRQSIEEIKDCWDTILEEITKIENKNEAVILIGDANRHISNTLVKDNHSKSSPGGKLMVDFLDNN